MKQTIHNLDSLETEIYRRKLQAKMLEEKINMQANYLQEHYRGMIVNSLFRSDAKAEGNGKAASWLQAILQHEKVQHTMNKVADHLAEKASERINSFIDRVLKK